MKVFYMTLLCLPSTTYGSSLERSLDIEQFVTLTLEDDDAAASSQTDHEARLSKTRQLMELAESLMRSTQDKDEKARQFARDALAKKNEKHEDKASLSSKLSLYQKQIEQMIQVIEDLTEEIRRYESLIEQGEKGFEKLYHTVEHEKEHCGKLRLHSDTPQDAQRSSQERVTELATERFAAETALNDCEAKKKKMQDHLTYNKAIMAEMIAGQSLTQQELRQVKAIVTQLDAALITVGKKYRVIAPAVLESVQESHEQLRSAFDKKVFNGVYADEKGSETLWATFCRLLGYN